jgi:diacylglycerol kinase family enzyme
MRPRILHEHGDHLGRPQPGSHRAADLDPRLRRPALLTHRGQSFQPSTVDRNATVGGDETFTTGIDSTVAVNRMVPYPWMVVGPSYGRRPPRAAVTPTCDNGTRSIGWCGTLWMSAFLGVLMDEEPQTPLRSPHEPTITVARRWAARLALLITAAALVMPLIFAGLRSLVLLVIGAACLGAVAIGAWWALSHRGALRIAGIAVAVLAVAAIVIIFILANFWWIVGLSAGLWLLAGIVARAALRGTEPRMHEYAAAPVRQPFMIMNPRSGDGKVARFGLVAKAEALGAKVTLLAGPEHVDVAALARDAVAAGADVLGVAGGDGTQAQVAGVAAEHGVPLLVISAGTRNHFALDLGLDRDDPSRCLDALTDGVELRIDLGTVNGRPFVNNASFGAYAEVVQSPEYRADKTQTTLRQLPDLLVGHAGARLSAEAGRVRIEAPQAVLVSNNPYGTGDPSGLGRRQRLDLGTLGLVGVRVDNAFQAADLLRGAASDRVIVTAAKDVTVTADAPMIPVGVDGEALMLASPVRCRIHPGVLRVRVPRNRPGRTPRVTLDWRRVHDLAGRLFVRAGRSSPAIGAEPAAVPPAARTP